MKIYIVLITIFLLPSLLLGSDSVLDTEGKNSQESTPSYRGSFPTHHNTGNSEGYFYSLVVSNENERIISGRVVRVADGDTITVLDVANAHNKIRLYGIDAPEKAQDFGNKSREKLASLVAGKNIAVTVMDIDRYGRNVGRINIDGKEVAEEMLKAGMAWVYTAYCKIPECEHWKELETQAKTAKIGLWSNPTAKEPWLWRKEHRNN